MRRICGWKAVLVSFAAALLIFGISGVADAESLLDKQAREIAAALNCPVCGGLSVAEATTPLAQQMRDLIRKKLEEGESREVILQYFVDRYGESVLREPPNRGFGQVLWWVAAGILVVSGGALAYVVSGSWFRRPAPSVAAPAGSRESTVQHGKRSNEVQVWKNQRSRKRRK